MELRRELLKAKMDLLALQNKKDKVGALYELLKDLPAEKVKDLEDKIKLTIKSYSWKYKDKGKIYQTYA
jgi:hypothetical protein